jgi:hypothetical protein
MAGSDCKILWIALLYLKFLVLFSLEKMQIGLHKIYSEQGNEDYAPYNLTNHYTIVSVFLKSTLFLTRYADLIIVL